MSDSNSITVRRVRETTEGTTPTNDSGWLTFCLNSETLSADPQTVVSQKQCPGASGRMPGAPSIEQVNSGGSIISELSAGDYDDLMEAALQGTWSSNSLTVGTTKRFYTLEKAFADQTKWLQLKGQHVTGISVSAGQGKVGFTADFLGGVAIADAVASLVGSGSETGESGEASMAGTGVGSLEIDGSGVTPGQTTAIFTTLNFTLSNNSASQVGLGQTTPYGVRHGDATFTGRIEGLLTGSTGWDLYERALANNDLDIKWTITENSKSYTFDFPKVKVRGAAPRIQQRNGDVSFGFDFEAYDTAPIITRVP